MQLPNASLSQLFSPIQPSGVPGSGGLGAAGLGAGNAAGGSFAGTDSATSLANTLNLAQTIGSAPLPIPQTGAAANPLAGGLGASANPLAGGLGAPTPTAPIGSAPPITTPPTTPTPVPATQLSTLPPATSDDPATALMSALMSLFSVMMEALGLKEPSPPPVTPDATVGSSPLGTAASPFGSGASPLVAASPLGAGASPLVAASPFGSGSSPLVAASPLGAGASPVAPGGNPFAVLPGGLPNPFEVQNPITAAASNGQSLSQLTSNPANFILKTSPLAGALTGNQQFVRDTLQKDSLRKQGIDPLTGAPLPPKGGAAGAAAPAASSLTGQAGSPLSSILTSTLGNLGATPQTAGQA